MAEPAVRVSVRMPQLGDIQALEHAERVCFDDPWPGQFFASEMFAPGRFHRVLTDPAGNLVGYLFSAWQYLDLHVLKIATMPHVRRVGLARRLMAMAEEHVVSMGGDSITLEVRTTNEPALALYDALGYQRVGTRRHYYPNGEDAIVMSKHVQLLE